MNDWNFLPKSSQAGKKTIATFWRTQSHMLAFTSLSRTAADKREVFNIINSQKYVWFGLFFLSFSHETKDHRTTKQHHVVKLR